MRTGKVITDENKYYFENDTDRVEVYMTPELYKRLIAIVQKGENDAK